MQVFIKGNVPSSKNSKIKGMFFSKTVSKYLKSLGIKSFSSSRKEVVHYKTTIPVFPVKSLKQLFENKSYPLMVGFHFIRGTRHSADFNNLTQIIADLMTAYDIIPDDNMDYFFAIPYQIDGKYYSYCKENPGVIIKLLNND